MTAHSKFIAICSGLFLLAYSINHFLIRPAWDKHAHKNTVNELKIDLLTGQAEIIRAFTDTNGQIQIRYTQAGDTNQLQVSAFELEYLTFQ